MKTAGIIAEYNPFHNGHQYQIEEVRRQTGADYIIVAMSGDFLQRGIPAVTDKYTRARMALSEGADLILELPVVWSTASAEYFAQAGVSLLASTGVVDVLCYGAENINPNLTHAIVRLLTEQDPDFCSPYHTRISGLTRQGMSFPQARQTAACELLPQYPSGEIADFLSSPNNILALEYEKAITLWNRGHARPIRGHAIRRLGDGYHDTEIHSCHASAGAVRELLYADGGITASTEATLRGILPASSLALLKEAADQRLLVHPDAFSEVLYARLLSLRDRGYETYADCTSELSNRIAGNLDSYVSFTDYAGLLKTKELTHTRISRVLTHIMLGITQEDYLREKTPYLRVLGFRSSSKQILTSIKNKASVPLITKVADASGILPPTALQMLRKDLCAADLYRGISNIQCGVCQKTEYTHMLEIIAP